MRRPAGGARSLRARAGFTLFEVLAAVLVLGLIYTWLASINIEGLRAEGTSRRRLEASLLADAALATVEEAIALGTTPPLGATEETQGDYQVSVSAAPIDITPWLGEDALPPEGVSQSLLTLPTSGDAAFLRRVDVVVRWIEGVDEYEVHRTTFAYDTSALASLFPADGAEAGEGTGDEEAVDESRVPDLNDLQKMLEQQPPPPQRGQP